MELLLLTACMRRSSAGRVVVVLPYFGYKRDTGMPLSSAVSTHAATYLREGQALPLSASSVAALIEAAGADHVLTVDLSPPGFSQLEGFFRIPCDNVRSTGLAVEYLARADLLHPVVAAANESCIPLARDVVAGLGAAYPAARVDMAALFESPHRGAPGAGGDALAGDVQDGEAPAPPAGAATRIDLVGAVEGRDVVLVDDMIDTARTLVRRVEALKAAGARRVLAVASHGLFSRGALRRLHKSAVDRVIVTDTLPPVAHEAETCSKIVRLAVAPVLAEAIVRLHHNDSLQPLKVFSAANVEPRYRGQAEEEADGSEDGSGGDEG